MKRKAKNEDLTTSAEQKKIKVEGEKVVSFPADLETLYNLQDSLDGISDEGVKLLIERIVESISEPNIKQAVKKIGVRTIVKIGNDFEKCTMEAVSILFDILEDHEDVLAYECYFGLSRLLMKVGNEKLKDSGAILKKVQKLEQEIGRNLGNVNKNIRSICLELLPVLLNTGYNQVTEIQCQSITYDTRVGNLVKLLERYTLDIHPQVRKTCLIELFKLYSQGVNIGIDTYHISEKCCEDENEKVRLAAIDLLWAITELHPEHQVTITQFGEVERIRLVDNSFTKMCDMVNDNSVAVRKKAFSTLGKYNKTDNKFLLQTFSKQVMSNLKRRVTNKNAVGDTKDHRERKTKELTQATDMQIDSSSLEIKLLNTGAAGAFVHGLEDEFQEVRNAAIDSISSLSEKHPEFAIKSIDFLVDMFNDSSNEARLNAISVLNRIGRKSVLELTEEQLLIGLSAMQDSDYEIREQILLFLSVSRANTKESLHILLESLHSGIKTNPKDKMSTFYTFSKIGQNHSHIVDTEFVASIFDIKKDYLPKNPNLEDNVYAGNIIMVMNLELETRKKLINTFPNFLLNSVSYFVSKYPNCFPQDILEGIPKSDQISINMISKLHADKDQSLRLVEEWEREVCVFFTRCWRFVASCYSGFKSLDSNGRALVSIDMNQFWHKKNRMLLQQLTKLSQLLDTTVSMHSDYFAFELCYLNIISSIYRLNSMVFSKDLQSPASSYSQPKISVLKDIITQINHLLAIFSGVSHETLLEIDKLRLFVCANRIYLDDTNISEFATLFNSFVSECQRIRDDLKSLGGGEDLELYDKFLSGVPPTVGANSDEFVLLCKATIEQFIRDFVPLNNMPRDYSNILKICAEINTPASTMPVEFNYLFPYGLDLDFTVYGHLNSIGDLAVMLSLPTSETIFCKINNDKETTNSGIKADSLTNTHKSYPNISGDTQPSSIDLHTKVYVRLPCTSGEISNITVRIVRMLDDSFSFQQTSSGSMALLLRHIFLDDVPSCRYVDLTRNPFELQVVARSLHPNVF